MKCVVYVGLAIALGGMAFCTFIVSTGKLALHNHLFAVFCCPGGCVTASVLPEK